MKQRSKQLEPVYRLLSAGLLTLDQREARLLSGDRGASGTELAWAVRRHPALSAATTVIVREGPDGCVATGGQLADPLLLVAGCAPGGVAQAFSQPGEYPRGQRPDQCVA